MNFALKSMVPFKSYVIEDGYLITGQNPSSAKGVGEAVVKALQSASAKREQKVGAV